MRHCALKHVNETVQSSTYIRPPLCDNAIALAKQNTHRKGDFGSFADPGTCMYGSMGTSQVTAPLDRKTVDGKTPGTA